MTHDEGETGMNGTKLTIGTMFRGERRLRSRRW